MFDFSSLSNNLEGYSLTNVITIALVSFVLSSLIAFTYQKTLRELESPKYFIQSLILISIPVATVMQAIGDSLARGLGLLGALAIIRFRTTLRNPRNMVFMFASISVGIACGVYGLVIGIVGTAGFCLVVILIHFSTIGKMKSIVGILRFEIPNQTLFTTTEKDEIDQIIYNYCIKVNLTRYDINKKRKKKKPIENTEAVEAVEVVQAVVYEYKIVISNQETAKKLANELSDIEGVFNVKINFNDGYEKI